MYTFKNLEKIRNPGKILEKTSGNPDINKKVLVSFK